MSEPRLTRWRWRITGALLGVTIMALLADHVLNVPTRQIKAVCAVSRLAGISAAIRSPRFRADAQVGLSPSPIRIGLA